MSWIKWAKLCHPSPLVYIFNTRIKLCHLKIYFLYIYLYLLQVVDNTFITYWRTHLPVHDAFRLELCCFPFELVPPHVFTSKDAVLLIITGWPTLMPSLTSHTFHFPTSHEHKQWSFFFSLFMYLLSTSKGVFMFLCSSHSPLTWTRFFWSSPCISNFGPEQSNMFLWTVSLIPSLQSVTSRSLNCIGYEFRMTFSGSDVHSLVNRILCSAINVPIF